LASLASYFDVCLIDTPPFLGVAMASAVLASDYLMSPVEMEAYSLQGMEMMLTVVGNLRQQNPGLEFLGMLPNKLEKRKPRHQANLAALRDAYPGFVMPTAIGARDSIAEALGEKKPVWRITKTAARTAKKEVRGMTDFVFDRMGLAA
jgi:chromosome partitioning protein